MSIELCTSWNRATCGILRPVARAWTGYPVTGVPSSRAEEETAVLRSARRVGLVNDSHVGQIFRFTRERAAARQRQIGETSIKRVLATRRYRQIGHPGAALRMEPRSLECGGQPPRQGQALRRGRLFRTHGLRTRKQRSVHQYRSRHDHPLDRRPRHRLGKQAFRAQGDDAFDAILSP